MFLVTIKKHASVIVLGVLGLFLVVMVSNYFLMKKQIQDFSPYYQKIAEKYCSKKITEKKERENCLSSIQSAESSNYRLVAPFSVKQVPSIAKCGTSVLMMIGPDYGEMFDWCDDNEGDRTRIITFVNFDIVANTQEAEEKYLGILKTLSQQYGEPIETTAFMIESESGTTLIGKMFFNKQLRNNNASFTAQKVGNTWSVSQ